MSLLAVTLAHAQNSDQNTDTTTTCYVNPGANTQNHDVHIVFNCTCAEETQDTLDDFNTRMRAMNDEIASLRTMVYAGG